MMLSKPVVAAVDLSSCSDAVLLQAAETAAVENVPLIAVHVVNPAKLPHLPGGHPAPKLVDDACLYAADQLSEIVSRLALGISVQEMVLVGRPHDELQKLVKREQAGLLVVSANKPTRKNLGSIASRCVRTVDCDVLLVREKTERGFKRIVACLDLSSASDHVLARGIEAARDGAHLDITHVSFPTDDDRWREALGGEDRQASTAHRAFTENALGRVLGKSTAALAAINHRVNILNSPVPSVELTCHIAETGADLAIIGTRGHSKLGAMLFGTNAERLLHDVPASVLAVRI